MKVLVTGARGQVGRAVLKSAPSGVEVLGVGRLECDMADEQSIRSAISGNRPDVVINAAAYTAVDRAEAEEKLAAAINSDAVGVIADELQRYGGQLVQLSTDFVFDGTSARAYTPSDPVCPLSAYGRSKASGETAAGENALIVRTSWVYAAGGANFVNTMLKLMAERDELRVIADQIGSPTWAAGLAQTLWGLILNKATGTVHHSDAGVASWYDFALAIQEEAFSLGILNKQATILPIRTEQYPTPAARPRFSLLDDQSTRALLDDSAAHWRVNLRRMLIEQKAML